MRAVAFIMLLFICVLPGCLDVGTVPALMSEPPTAIHTTDQTPDNAIGSLAVVADGEVGRVEYIDAPNHLLVISNKHPMTSERMSMIIVRAEPMQLGSQLTMWSKASVGSKQALVDKFWKLYVDRVPGARASAEATQ